MEVSLMQSPAGDSSKQSKRRRRRKSKNQGVEKAAAETRDLANDDLEGPDKVANIKSKKGVIEADLSVKQLHETPKMDAGSIENVSEGCAKKKKKKRKKKKATVKDEVQSTNLIKMDTGPIENLVEDNVNGKRKKNAEIKDEVKSMEQAQMDGGTTENLTEGNVTGKRKRKRKSSKAKNKAEAHSMSEARPMHLLDGKHGLRTDDKFRTDHTNHESQFSVRKEGGACHSDHNMNREFEKGLSSVKNGFILDPGKGFTDGRSVLSTSNVEAITHASSCQMKDASCLFPKMAPGTSIRRKLLVFDLNGLLVDIIKKPSKYIRGDLHISKRAIFKRPFLDDFLKFCFQNFDVGIWTSRPKGILDEIINYLLGDLKEKLLFCWDASHCTPMGSNVLGRKKQQRTPLVCKELRKIWESDDPNLPWKKGDYNESNTLLLDDSPHKALLNPLHTAVFPPTYCYIYKRDNALGPKGGLRHYLKGLLKHENVQKYVEQHPFGEKAITEKHSSWKFYQGVLQRMSQQLKDETQ